MNCQIRSRQRGVIREWLITASAPAAADPSELLAAVWEPLQAAGAHILLERWFGPATVRAEVLRLRARHATDDDPPPTWLTPPAGRLAGHLGVAIHAVAGLPRPTSPAPGVRVIQDASDLAWVTIQGCVRPTCAAGWDALEANLAVAHVTPEHLVRTWLWVDHILDHYGELNRSRTDWFRRHALLGTGQQVQHMPASTAVGVDPGGGVAMDAIAVRSRNRPTTCVAAGNQRSAFAYGSAFARAAIVQGFTGPWLTISGTAAIDADGRTTHPGDPCLQITDALDNLQAVWRQHGRTDQHVVQTIAYCSTELVANAWRQRAMTLPWPCMTVLADICRADLAFEIEALVDLHP